jgi:hypothetical protein
MDIRKTKLVLAAAASAAAMAVPAAGAAPTSAAPVIQPGVSLDFGGSFCTANWVYDGANGAVYIGAARHCTNQTVGQVVYLATGSLGTDVERIGTVAYWGANLDYSLVQLDPGVLGQVQVTMAGHPTIPTGVATPADVAQGDLVQFSGHGVGVDATTATQQQRVGVFMYFDGQGNYVTVGAVTPGDSGGPVGDITDGNRALGIVDTVGINLAFPGGAGTEEGVAVASLIADASAHFAPISLAHV